MLFVKRRLPSLILALAVATTAITPAAAEPSSAPPVLDTRFGIAEGFRNAGVMADIGAGWERLILPWDQLQPSGPGDFSMIGRTLGDAALQGEVNAGVKVAGVFEFTPGWAQGPATIPGAPGHASPPKNLSLAFDDPNNYFGRLVSETVSRYRGRIDQWVIWNEPEFQPQDPNGPGAVTWAGSDAQFAQLMKVGYLAAKKANPNAIVSFPGTSYWTEKNAGRAQFYDRVMAIIAQDPSAAQNNYYHDATALNLYRAPDDMLRVYNEFKGIQQKYGIDKPIWLTETNAMPTDDTSVPCADRQQAKYPKTTQQQQAAYAMQTFALAAAAGYQRIEWYQMIDGDDCAEPLWGVSRPNGSLRPVKQALKTAVSYFSGFTSAQFVPLTRETQGWPAWPDDPTSLTPNWQVYQVALDRPGNQRVTALWNGDGQTLTTRIRKTGSSAQAFDKNGNPVSVTENQGWWVVDLPGASAFGQVLIGSQLISDPDGYHFIGGDPVLLVEKDVAPGTRVERPRLGQPGSVPREFVLNAAGSPPGNTVNFGDGADFYFKTFVHEDFGDPLTLNISQWSTQRFPDPQDGSTFPIGVTMPTTINPGDSFSLHLDTSTAPEPGIYYFTVQATGGEMTRTVDVALVVN